MRTAALPNFRKPYRKLIASDYKNGLPAGKYLLRIEYSKLSVRGSSMFITCRIPGDGL